ncbi:DUF883 family protein [Rhizobium sp. PAMB 3174]
MATATVLKNNAKTDYASAADIEEQLQKLSADVAALTKTMADFGNGKMDEAVKQARSLKDDMVERSAVVAADTKKRLVSAESDFEDQVRAHPLAAIGIAAGVGFLAALMSKR